MKLLIMIVRSNAIPRLHDDKLEIQLNYQQVSCQLLDNIDMHTYSRLERSNERVFLLHISM